MMFGFLQTAFERFAGRGSAAVTIPAMDGPLGPNTRLEDAASLLDIAMPDNLVQADDVLYFSSGARLLRLNPADAQTREITSFGHVVTALAAAPDGTLAVGLDNGSIVFTGGSKSHEAITGLPGVPAVCPTALAFVDSKTLLLCHGSNRHPPSKWQWSLMEDERSGSVWIYDLDSRKATCLAGDIAYPNGLAVLAQAGEVVVSEAWRHHLIRVPLSGAGRPVPVLENLPGYPARISEAADGGFWLSVFAPRSQLIELVLKEPVYKRKMMREIPNPNLWIAPALSSGDSFLEPLQGGAVKQMGILKPWAPTRSYGLVIRLSPQFLALESLHSRADGDNHGVKSCIDLGGRLLVASTGGNKILSVAVG
jgi:hypothetical protein